MSQPAFDFKRDVVDLSFEKPVLLDFWAPWCGPCKVLGPVLEALETEDQGKWALVKINTEEEQDIAAYFRIQSIPNCKLVYEGKIVDEFTGAQSRETIRKWLDQHFSNLNLPEAVEAQVDDFDELILGQTDFPDANFAEKLKLFLSGHPDHEKALETLIKHEAFLNGEQTQLYIATLSASSKRDDLEQDSHAINEWMQIDATSKNKAAQLLISAKSNLFAKRLASTIEEIIEAVHKDPAFQNELPRRAGIALFHFLGPQHAMSLEYRKLFDMAIY